MPEVKITTKTLPVGQIDRAHYNPRVNLKPEDKEYRKIAKSLLSFGLVEPLVWNQRTGRLVGGHQRLTILMDMGVKKVPVSVVDLDDRQEKVLNLALNKQAGRWDDDLLKDLCEDLDRGDIDMEIAGFDTGELKLMMTAIFQEELDQTDDGTPRVGGAGCPYWQDGKCCQ